MSCREGREGTKWGKMDSGTPLYEFGFGGSSPAGHGRLSRVTAKGPTVLPSGTKGPRVGPAYRPPPSKTGLARTLRGGPGRTQQLTDTEHHLPQPPKSLRKPTLARPSYEREIGEFQGITNHPWVGVFVTSRDRRGRTGYGFLDRRTGGCPRLDS